LSREQLDDVAKARPEITKTVENMVSKGKWTVPGYTESESAPSYTLLYQSLLTRLSCFLAEFGVSTTAPFDSRFSTDLTCLHLDPIAFTTHRTSVSVSRLCPSAQIN
jgi:hypothetical protein